MDDVVIGWIGTLVAIVGYGLCLVPLKFKSIAQLSIEPLVYNIYMCLGIAVTSLLVLFLSTPVFSLGSVAAGTLWCLGNAGGVVAIGYLGLSITSGAWSGLSMLVTFLWGQLYFHDPLRSLPLSILSLALLLLGVVLLSLPGTGLLPKLAFLQPFYRYFARKNNTADTATSSSSSSPPPSSIMSSELCQGSICRLSGSVDRARADLFCRQCNLLLCTHCSHQVHEVLPSHQLLELAHEQRVGDAEQQAEIEFVPSNTDSSKELCVSLARLSDHPIPSSQTLTATAVDLDDEKSAIRVPSAELARGDTGQSDEEHDEYDDLEDDHRTSMLPTTTTTTTTTTAKASQTQKKLIGASAGSAVLLQPVQSHSHVDLDGQPVEHHENMGRLTQWLHALLDWRNARADRPPELQRSAVRLDQATGTAITVPTPENKLRDVAIGMTICFTIACLSGSQMVATKLVDAAARDSIMLFFGFTTFFVATMLATLWFLLVKRQVPKFHLAKALPAGLVSGAIWAVANYSAILSCRYLGVGIGGTLTNLCMIVSGVASIFVFKEVTDKVAILWWSLSVLVILFGALLLGYAGSV